MLTLLLAHTVVFASSFLIAGRLFKLKESADFIQAFIIIFISFIVIIELSLGILGKLAIGYVVLFCFAILLIVLITTKNIPSAYSFKAYYLNPDIIKSRINLFILSIIVCFASVKLFINLINPPFGWDCLNYHFTFPVEWLKNGNLNNPITVFDDPSPAYYPINGSLFFFWLMLPLKNVFLADLGQMPFFILAFLAVYSIGRKLSLKTENAFLAACLFTLIPNYFKQLEIAYVDVMVGALFLASLNFLLLLKEEFSLKNIVIYSLTLGLLLGVKTVALPYSLLLFAPFIYLCARNINRPYAMFLSIIIVILFGGFSYIRNFADTGNPLYPLDFKLFGKTIFKGVMSHTTYSAHFTAGDYNLSKILFHEGMGVQSLILILPAIFLSIPVTLIKKEKKPDFIFFYFLALPYLVYLVYRYLIPLANTRYLYALLGLGAVIAFYCIEALKIPQRITKTIAIICVLASIPEIAKHQELIIGIILSILFFLLFRNLPLSITRLTRKPASIFACLIIFIFSLIFLQYDYIRNEYDRYVTMVEYSGFWPEATQAWKWLNTNTNSNNIAYAGRPVPFPLYGTNFKNNVYYVSVNKTEPAKLHYFKESFYQWGQDFESEHQSFEQKGNLRQDADFSAWLNNLLKRKIDYLFVYSLHQTKDILFPMEDKWALERPDKFIPVFGNQTIHIYRLIK